MLTIDEILSLLSELSGKKKNAELADELGVSRQVLGTWKKRGTIPYEVLCQYAVKNNVSLDYLFLGEEKNNNFPHQAASHQLDGILLRNILERLSKTECYQKTRPENLADISAYIFNQIDMDAEYTDQLIFIDKIIAWYLSILYETDITNVHFDDFSNPQKAKRLLKVIQEGAEQEYKLYCLSSNYSQKETFIESKETIINRHVVRSLETGIDNYFLIFDFGKSNQNFFDSIVDIDTYIEIEEFLLEGTKNDIREEIDELTKKGFEVRTEYLSNPNSLPKENT